MEAKDWDERYATRRQWSLEPNRWVVQELASSLPGRALDAACGEGRNAIWLAQEGWSVLGVDFSQRALDRAAQAAAAVSAPGADSGSASGTPLDVEWQCLDITEPQAVTGQFDLVLCAYVHLPAYERTPLVRAVAAALSTGGTLLVIGHDSTNLTDGYGGPQDAELLYTAQDVEADLQDIISSGVLAVERASRVAREVETAEGPQVAWDFLFRARRRDNTKDELSFV